MTNGGRKEEPHIGTGEQQDPAAAWAAKRDQVKNNIRWERELIERLATFGLKEQRSRRRWGIFFKVLIVVYILVLTLQAMPGLFTGESSARHTALVEIRGVIADDAEANADSIINGLRNAFEDERTAGVILRINSPGGSPVQAGYVNDEIARLRERHPDIALYAVVTDMCASGGYYIAAAADEIYADKASIVGSIGVVMNGFGFVEALDKLGIERRLLTAGDNKGFLDPFSPLEQDEVAHIKDMLANVHQQFINVVKQGRGDRLVDDPRIFSGLVWTGEQGVQLGLVDGLGSSSFVAREIVGVEQIVDFTHRPPVFERFVDRVTVGITRALTATGARLN